jgi:beta-galactosidase GanA
MNERPANTIKTPRDNRYRRDIAFGFWWNDYSYTSSTTHVQLCEKAFNEGYAKGIQAAREEIAKHNEEMLRLE